MTARGMSPEQCEKLNEALKTPGGGTYDHGYGLFNVNNRIRLSHGDAYGLSYALNEAGGVTVTILHPIIRRARRGGGGYVEADDRGRRAQDPARAARAD
jgi:sensor histidine kinase YesM